MRDNIYKLRIILFVLLFSCIVGCPHKLWAQGDMDLPSLLVPRLYRNPGAAPYEINKIYNGISLDLSWTSQLQVHPEHSEAEKALTGWSIVLNKSFDKHGALRIGYERQSENMSCLLGYDWNLSNSYWGFDPARPVQYLLTMGAMAGKTTNKWWGGGYLGVQMNKTLSPCVDMFVEPQLRIGGNHADGFANIVPTDASMALRTGIKLRLTPPYMFYPVSDYLLVNRYHGLQRFYTELAGGVQYVIDAESYNTPYWGGFDMTVGYQINQLWGIKTTIFSERIGLSEQNMSEPYFGMRLELATDILHLFWAKSRANGWVIDVSVGGEVGRIETKDHLTKPYYHNYGKTWAIQLRRLLSGNLWAFVQGRSLTISTSREQSIYSAQLGLHYELSERKSINDAVSSYYAMGGIANLDAENRNWQLGIGYNFNGIHGLRTDFISSYNRTISTYSDHSGWNTISADYLCNISNLALGEKDDRRLSLLFLAGYNLSIHDKKDKDWFGERLIFWGIETGCQFDLRLSQHVSLYCEEKSIFQPFDTHVSPIAQQAWHIVYSGGLKIRM